MSTILTVSQINTYIRSVIDYDMNLKNIYVSGEISNFTNHYRTGHFYFTLKDEKASIKSVMFRNAAERVRFKIENGMKVLVRGNISVFERDGVYQLYAEDIVPDGIGALNLAYEQLKQKLGDLGFFDPAHKKPLVRFPERIGVITSPTGAAVHDIITVLERRYPYCKIVFEPVSVQGNGAAEQIAGAVEKFNLLEGADVIIVGRGGGSIEDLWAFNEECVARAVYNSDIPIISAVGHETDYTIIDFVSDVRAATPSAAAELAVPDMKEVVLALDKLSDKLAVSLENIITKYEIQLEKFEQKLDMHSPENSICMKLDTVAALRHSLTVSISRIIEKYQTQTTFESQKLEALSPLKIISKGYCAVSDENGNSVCSIEGLNKDDCINLLFKDGTARCKVITAIPNRKDGSDEKIYN